MFEHLRGDRQERGAAIVEYFFLMGLIAVTLLLSVNLLRGSIDASFSEVGQSLQSGVSVQTDDDTETHDDSDSHDDDSDS